MAGETNKAAEQRAAERRKRLSASIPQTADNKYYKSGDRSVINNTAADTKGRAGDAPQPIPTPKIKHSDIVQSADKKYYSNSTPQAPTKEQIEQAARKGIKLAVPGGVPVIKTGRAVGKSTSLAAKGPVASNIGGTPHIRIRTVEEVHPLMEHVAELLNGGHEAIVVEVPKGDLTRRVRAKLDSLVTREIVTEDQARDVRFSSYDPNAAPLPAQAPVQPPPEPKGEVNVDDDESGFLDPGALLTGGLDLEEKVDVSPDENAPEVALTATGAIASDEDDSDDFMSPESTRVSGVDPAAPGEDKTVVAIVHDNKVEVAEPDVQPSDSIGITTQTTGEAEAAAGAPEESSAQAEESDSPRRPGRRSGRGSR